MTDAWTINPSFISFSCSSRPLQRAPNASQLIQTAIDHRLACLRQTAPRPSRPLPLSAVSLDVHTGAHPVTRFGESDSWGSWSYGSVDGAIWTRENDVGKVFPCEDQGGRGITVAVVSRVATWLHCGRSPQGI